MALGAIPFTQSGWEPWAKFGRKADDLWVGANLGSRLEVFARQGRTIAHCWQQ